MTRTATRRRVSRLPRQQRMADIMLAARIVFGEKGYENALLSEIAERAGVVEGSIYRYFANKRDLLVKVVEHWYQELLADEDAGLSAVRGTRNRLRYVIWKHVLAIHEEPALSRLVFYELRPDPDYRSTAVFDLNRAYTSRLTDVVREAVESGEFRSDTPLPVVRDMVFGCIEHRTWSFLRGYGDFSVDQTADAIAEIVYRGLLAHAGPAPDAAEATLARLERVADRLEQAAATGKDRR